VGTTIAPWQLFFQQSYVIDKRITPRFIRYEKVDLWIGIVIVIVGAAAMMGFTAAAFAGHGGGFTDAAGVARGLEVHAGRVAGVLFAIALLDASIIGACAVSLSTAYAVGDVLGMNHSLHRGVGQARGFYAVFAGIVGLSATIVLLPGSPLGLLTEGVQTLAGVLLPSASLFLLLLCNDRDVLGPWTNGRRLNVFASAVVGVLVMLSLILTASVVFPNLTPRQMLEIMGGFVALALGGAAAWAVTRTRRPDAAVAVAAEQRAMSHEQKLAWRMPPLDELAPPRLSAGRRLCLMALSGYLVIAVAMVVVRVAQIALAGH
jgi:hypothetical protein